MKITIARLFDQGDGGDAGSEDTGSEVPDPLKDWTGWLATLEEPVAKAFEQHTTNLRSALQKERDNASTFKPFKKKAEEAEALVATLRDRLSDVESRLEKASQEVTTHKGLYDALLLETAVVKAASTLRFQDPDDAYALLTPDEKALLKIESNVVVGADEAVKKLLDRKSYLVLMADQGSGLGNAIKRPSGKKDKTETPAATSKTRL